MFYKTEMGILMNTYLFQSPKFTMLKFSIKINVKPAGPSPPGVEGTWVRTPEVNH